jgi:putative ABC transport system substrate-binding protein
MLPRVPSPTTPARQRRLLNLTQLALVSLGLLLLVGGPVQAQEAGPAPAQVPPVTRLVRIGILTDAFDRADPTFPQFEGQFITGLADLGYIEGQQYEFVVRTSGGDTAALPGAAVDLVAQQVDVIVAYPTVATLAAKAATSSIPIVMPYAGAPIESGLVESLEHPGGNVTGLANLAPLGAPRRLELLAQVTGGQRFAFFTQPTSTNPSIGPSVAATQQAARQLGATVQVEELTDYATGLPGAFDRARAAGAAGFLLYGGTLTGAGKAVVFSREVQDRLPGMFETAALAEQGGLMGYGPNIPDLFRRAAGYVDQVLRGADPASLAIGTPERYDFAVNLKTAAALGIAIPPEVMAQATEIIQ